MVNHIYTPQVKLPLSWEWFLKFLKSSLYRKSPTHYLVCLMMVYKGQKGVHRIKVCCKQWDSVRDISSTVDFFIRFSSEWQKCLLGGGQGIEHIILYMVEQEVMRERTFFVSTHWEHFIHWVLIKILRIMFCCK